MSKDPERAPNRAACIALALLFGLSCACAAGRASAADRVDRTRAVDSTTGWLDRQGVDAKERSEAAAIVARARWAAWPELTADGIVYRAPGAVQARVRVCQIAAAQYAAQVGTELADHDVKRLVEVLLRCQDGEAVATWRPSASGRAHLMATATLYAAGAPIASLGGDFDYTPQVRGATGVAFESEFLAATAFEETPRLVLDFGSAVNEDWFKQRAQTPTPLECWPSLWGGLNRQCVVQLPPLQPRQCAALALHTAYRDLIERVNRGLSPRHAFELMAWCGENHARVRFPRDWRVEVEWFRDDAATSELGTTIARRPPVALGRGGDERAKFLGEVDARDGAHGDALAEAYRRASLVARWFGVAADDAGRTPDALQKQVDLLAGKLTCAAGDAAALTPWSCTVSGPAAPEGPACRARAFASAYALPLAKKGPLAGKREFTITLACGSQGRKVVVEREHDYFQIVESKPGGDRASDVPVWTERFENVREVR